jgi:hypothetical protein
VEEKFTGLALEEGLTLEELEAQKGELLPARQELVAQFQRVGPAVAIGTGNVAFNVGIQTQVVGARCGHWC